MNRLTGSVVQVLMKTTWALAVVVAMWLLSKGILASWRFEPRRKPSRRSAGATI